MRRISIKGALLLTAICALLMSCIGERLSASRKEEFRARALEDLGASVLWGRRGDFIQALPLKGLREHPTIVNLLAPRQVVALSFLPDVDRWRELGGVAFVGQQPFVSGRALSDSSVSLLVNFKSLKALTLARARLTDAGVANLAECRAIETLDLSFTDISDGSMAILATLPRLREVSLDDTKITDAGIYRLLDNKTLEVLSAQRTMMGDAALRSLGERGQIVGLDVSGCHVTDAGLSGLGRLSSLRALSLGGCAGSDKALEQLTLVRGLESLSVDYSDVGSAGLAALAHLPGLRRLSMRGLVIDEAVVDSLSKCRSLRMLYVTHVTSRAGCIPQLKMRLTECEIFDD